MASVSSTVNAFMARFVDEGLTFDDVTLNPNYADFEPREASVASRFSRSIRLNVPFVSAAMDTVTEANMAVGMAMNGGIGVIHKNLSVEQQVEQVRQVKGYLHGLISSPVVFPKDITVRQLLDEKDRKKFKFGGFPIVDSAGKLCGILTARDLKFVRNFDAPVSEVMTTRLVTAPVETTLDEAFEIMLTHRIGKLPIVDEQGRLAGLYSFHDVKSISENIEPDINRDARHRLRVAAAVSPSDFDRAEQLIAADVDAVVIDTAHGYTKGVVDTIRQLKNSCPEVDVVAGNIGDGEAAKLLLDAGADALKVGIGPGSICTTRVVCGVGVPQLSAVYDVVRAIGDEVPVIADGGIKNSGDVVKALAFGADSVMMGGVLAGTNESPGEKILHQGRTYVVYRGMGSMEAMKSARGSRERYGQADVMDESKLVPQGIEGLVPYRGTIEEVLTQFVGGLRFSLGYNGARTVAELRRNVRPVRVSLAGLHEAHPHDIKIIKDAPNYSTSQ